MSQSHPNKASQNEYWSVDSQPAKFSGHVPKWKAPALLLFFVLFSFSTMYVLQHDPLLGQFFLAEDWVFAPVGTAHFLAIRHFILCFFVSFALFANGPAIIRFGFGVNLILSFVFACLLIDLFAFSVALWLEIPVSLRNIQIAAGLVGFAIFSARLSQWGAMPDAIKMTIQPRKPIRSMARMLIVTLSAGAFAWWVSNLDMLIVAQLRSVALLGGLGPGVFLFLPSLFLMLYLIAQWDRLFEVRARAYTPALTIVIPAHNEEYIIADTIGAIDAAAAKYVGAVTVFVVNNNSSDGTYQIADNAIQTARHISGRVLNEPRPGKAHALNYGFSMVETDYTIRIDADTQIDKDSLWRAMAHFKDPELGCLGGVPNTRGRTFFERARLAEVLVNHGYHAIATESIDGLVAIPGMFAAYRADLPGKLEGFAFGLNGEDSDMSMRIAELGYRITVDPFVRYESEVPASFSHMREQRMRWFRSAFHISARCHQAMELKNGSLRGILILPIMLLNTAIRAMLLPLILFGTIESLEPFSQSARPQWQAIAAVVLGSPTLVAIGAILINRAPKGLLYLPEYTLFRLFRGYFTLESMLSITLKKRATSSPLKHSSGEQV